MVCPLDWGLGHATRCVPVIQNFLDEGHQVIIGADKNPLAFLKEEFPKLKTVVIPGLTINYGEKGSSLKLFYESVKFLNYIKQEKQFIDEFLAANKVDMIVSDNRYGLYSDKIESIIITHQLYPKAPVGEKLLHQKIEKLLGNFNEVWIPDFDGENNLSGDLAHLKPFQQKHKFIGALSRFSSSQPTTSCHTEFIEVSRNKQAFDFDICAIISGPEPQRTIFEKLIFEQIEKHQLKAVVVRGLPEANVIASCHPECSTEQSRSVIEGYTKQSAKNDEILGQARNDGSIKIFNHLPTQQLQAYILKSKKVVCRSGYSSIMDLVALNKKAILVPTPGQTEQEYLAEYHHKKGLFVMQGQKQLNLG